FDLKPSDAGDTFVVMEYVAGPSLASVLKQYPNGLPLSEIRHWLRGLVEGVAYLHDHGIVHRDLKPANLFMEEGIVKIGDYGLAKDPNQRPSRVYDLLPPEDAPRAPEVRIIGDGKAGGPPQPGAARRPPVPPEEELLRIEAEEPVFYIGPETRPPRGPGRTIG